MSTPTEKSIEARFCKKAKAAGALVYKFSSPAKRGVPDRLFILPKGPGIKLGDAKFVEFKRPGGKLSKLQEHQIGLLRAQGVDVRVVSSHEEADTVLKVWGLL